MRIVRSVYLSWVLLSWLFMAGTSTVYAAGKSWTNNEAMLAYFEVLQLIESRSLAQTPLATNVESSIDHVLSQIDPYCLYLNPEDYRAYLDTLETTYSGIGADLTLEPDGKVILHPRPGSPAIEAGVENGDQLFAVDKQSIENLSLIEVTSRIRGTVGTGVRVFVKNRMVELEPTRSPVLKPAPLPLKKLCGRGLKHSGFTNSLPRQKTNYPPRWKRLTQSLTSSSTSEETVEGTSFAAIQCAKLFLPGGAFVVRISKTDTEEAHETTVDGPFQSRELFLLQDPQTASAAEVFIDALIQNKNASNWGTISYGKAVTQQVFPMSNGGALFLTDGILERQDGSNWNGKGLEPEGELQDLLNRLLSPQPNF